MSLRVRRLLVRARTGEYVSSILDEAHDFCPDERVAVAEALLDYYYAKQLNYYDGYGKRELFAAVRQLVAETASTKKRKLERACGPVPDAPTDTVEF